MLFKKSRLMKIACTGVTLTGFILIGILTFTTFKGAKISNEDFNKVVQKTEVGYELKAEAAEHVNDMTKTRLDPDDYKNHTKTWAAIHEMANSVVIAEEKWGKTVPTEEGINMLIVVVIASNFDDKDKLLEILGRWKEGCFSKADEDHNYVWLQLKGSVGKATGVDWNAIPTWAKNKTKE